MDKPKNEQITVILTVIAVVLAIPGTIYVIYDHLYPQATAQILLPTQNNTPLQDNRSTQDTGVCYYDWKELNRSTDSSGYSNITIKLYIKNDATKPVDTLPVFWRINANGQIYHFYMAWSNLSSDEHLWVKLGKGGVAESRIQYLVKGTPSIDDVVNTEFGAPKMQRIKYY